MCNRSTMIKCYMNYEVCRIVCNCKDSKEIHSLKRGQSKDYRRIHFFKKNVYVFELLTIYDL